MNSLGHRQCRHPAQPMGGVCAACLKQRLSRIGGLHCGSGAAITCDVSERQPSTLNALPLKQLLGKKSDLRQHVEAPAEMFNEVMLMSQDITEARQSIASLIERDIVEAHRRYSDVASRCCYEASNNQLLRSKSTSQLDGNKSLQLTSSHRRPRSGGQNTTIKSLKESFASSALKPLVHHHDLRRGTTPSPQCHRIGGKQMRFELQDKTAQPLLRKSKSTGWILNHHLARDCNNKRSERRSPIDLLSWRKKRKTSSVSNATSLEDSTPLMMAPCSRKDGAFSSIKTKENMWRPLKILFRWRGTPRKPAFAPPMAPLGTPRSTSSSSSSCTHRAAEQNLHHEVSLPKLDDHVEPEHVVCGRRLHRLLSQVRPQSSSNADEKVGNEVYMEQTVCSQKEVCVSCSSDSSQDVDSIRHKGFHDDLQSSALEEGSRRRAGGEAPLKRGQGTSALMSSSRVLKVAKSTGSSIKESSMCSALSASLPSFTTVLDPSMIYSNSKLQSGNACVVSIAALISMDVNTTSPLKMAC